MSNCWLRTTAEPLPEPCEAFQPSCLGEPWPSSVPSVRTTSVWRPAMHPRNVPFFSPTARYLPIGRRGVYSLGAGDPGAGFALAEAVADLGYSDAVVIHPRSAGERLEAVAFQEAFAASGGIVRRRIPYQPGTTTFEEPLTEVMLLAPSLLVIVAPPDDVELLAPQIAFFGLDELGLQVAGTAAWTAPSVIELVARRHTDGVIALSTVPPGTVREPPADFVNAYERRFRRSLHGHGSRHRLRPFPYGAGRVRRRALAHRVT